jgi:hypothetical protein
MVEFRWTTIHKDKSGFPRTKFLNVMSSTCDFSSRVKILFYKCWQNYCAIMFTIHVGCALCLAHIGAVPKEEFVSNFL